MANLLDQLDNATNVARSRPRPSTGNLIDQIDSLGGPSEPESSVAGTVAKEAGKAFANFGLDALQGVESLLPGGGDRSLADQIREAAGETITPGEGAAATVGQAIGGIAPSFILGASVGLPATIGIFATSNFGRAIKEAEEAGLGEAGKFAFAAANAGIAPLEAVPVGRTLAFLNRGTGGLVQKLASKSGGTSVKKIIENVGRTRAGRPLLAVLDASVEEAIQEGFVSQGLENALARAFGVDPDRSLLEGAGPAALLGAIGGGAGAGAIAPFIRSSSVETGQPSAADAEGVQVDSVQSSPSRVDTATTAQPQQATADNVPIAPQVQDFAKPKQARVSEAGIKSIKAKPGQRIVSPEGTIITTPRQADLREQANRVLGIEAPVPGRFKTTGQKLLEEARRDNIPSQAREIAEKFNATSNPDPLNARTIVGMIDRIEQLDLESVRLIREIESAKEGGDATRIIDLGTNLERVRDEFLAIKTAVDTTGSDTGLALRARRFAIDEDMNIFTLEARAAAIKGAPLTEQEMDELRQAVAENDRLSEQVALAEERIRALEAEAELKSRSRRSKRRPGSKARSSKELNDSINDIVRLSRAGC